MSGRLTRDLPNDSAGPTSCTASATSLDEEEDAMRLVADRFAVDRDRSSGFALDLATRQRVWLEVMSCAGGRDQKEWLLRCDDLFRRRHPGMAPLVDYGLLGSAQYFEAWAAGSNWKGLDRSGPRLPELHGGDFPGIRLIERPALRALAEMVRDVAERRPRLALLWGPPGSGVRTAILFLAREARLNGLIPVDGQSLHSYDRLVAGRSLFVIDREPDRHLTTLLRAALAARHAHVHMATAAEERHGLEGVRLERVTPEELIASVADAPRDAAERRHIERAAERAHGLPGRFVQLLWRQTPSIERRTAVSPSRVAEGTACYGEEKLNETISVAVAPPAATDLWPVPGELAALRRHIEQAHSLLATGRHAPGIRLLRQTIGALARRNAWTNAAQGALTLATELLKRGRPRDALKVLDDAQAHASCAGDAQLLLDIAVLTGESRLESGRLDDAERVLTAAQTSARAAGDEWRGSTAATALARCLFWRGDYDDAAAALASDRFELLPPAALVRRLRLSACVAIAQGESARALAAIEEARSRAAAADHNDHARLRADVEHTSAFVKLDLGDLNGAARDADACFTLARAARHPLRGFCARLLRAEAGRRRGQAPAAVDLAALRRFGATAPPIVKSRWHLLHALFDTADARAAVARCVSETGLRALELFAPSFARSRPARSGGWLVADVIDIVRVCQNADDELAVLKDVCERVRRQLHAAAVAFALRAGGRCELVAADGARMETDIAVRATDSGITIGPHRIAERLEAAAPVQYAGSAVGALCARWTLGTTDDLSRAADVLAMAAAAAAPIASALLIRRSQAVPAAAELIGVTPAIGELRRAVEAAAAAPFPVLIEGESGSGKELVARGIHRASLRRDRQFCTLNCAALPEDLVESELFGHTRGAFTGAVGDRAGVFEEANGGMLFLDEVGELAPRAQAKLLRVIQEGEIRRVGENIGRRVDTRIVAATNRDLRREVEAGRFRLDLLYRLDVIRIVVPPLRERREDVAALVDYFWSDATRRTGSRAALSQAARAALASYDWPGNVRELQNVLAALAVRSPKRGVVPPTALPAHVVSVRRPEAWRLDAARRTFEEGFVRAALVRAGGHRGRAADELGVTRQGLTKLLTRLGIE